MTAFVLVAAFGAVLLLSSLLLGEVLDGLFDGLDVTGGYLSTVGIGAFAVAFGLTGFLAVPALGTAGATALATVVGALSAAGVGAATSALTRMGTDSTPRSADLAGLPGTVVTRIGAGVFGEVMVHVAGHPMKLNARADEVLAAGTRVWVVSALSETSVHVQVLPTWAAQEGAAGGGVVQDV